MQDCMVQCVLSRGLAYRHCCGLVMATQFKKTQEIKSTGAKILCEGPVTTCMQVVARTVFDVL